MIDAITKQVADNISRIRHDQNLTQVEVAKRADNMSSNHYAKVEQGKTKPSITVYERIAKGLGVELADIFKTS